MSKCIPRPDYHHPEASEISKSLKKSPSGQGFLHFASDGVMRSYNSKHEVVDYRQLSPVEIDIMLASYRPLVDSESYSKLEAKLAGKDGREVTDMNDLLHPGPSFRPLKQDEKTGSKTNNLRSASPSGQA